MLPKVIIQKLDGQTGSVPPGSTGILAVIAPSELGTQNQPASFTRTDLALAAYGNGPLVEDGDYDLAISGNQFLGIRPTTTTAAVYGSITKTGTGSSAITAGAGQPVDDFEIVVNWLTGTSAIGVAGATYQYSLDGGDTFSGVLALGTANALDLAMPVAAGGRSSGAQFSLGSGTIVAGDSFTCNVQHPRMNTSDLTTALSALRMTRLPWEGVLIDGEANTATIGLVDTWLQSLEGVGLFKFALLNTRHKTLPVPTAESEAAFLASMTTLVASSESIRLVVGSDAGDLTSGVTGLTLPRPVALALAARAMKIPLGEDPAFVGRGSVSGFSISDNQGNPKWHDEDLSAGLDDLRLASFRSFPPGAQAPGVYLTNAPVLSFVGSDYVYLQHIRTMNRACEIAYSTLSKQLSIGVGKQPPDPNTGAVYMTEADRQRIESLVQDDLDESELKGQVVGITFTLAGDDDISSNSGATIHGTVANEALAYVKKFAVTSQFVKSL